MAASPVIASRPDMLPFRPLDGADDFPAVYD